MEAELKQLEVSLVDLASKLASARHSLAQQLEIEIQQELKDLYMDKARFQVQFTKGKFSREGNESVESQFLIVELSCGEQMQVYLLNQPDLLLIA